MSMSKQWKGRKAKKEKDEKARVTIFPKGIMIFSPHENAPDFIKADIIIHPDKLFEWLGDNADLLQDVGYGDQLRLTLKESKAGELYCDVNTFKKQLKPNEAAK